MSNVHVVSVTSLTLALDESGCILQFQLDKVGMLVKLKLVQNLASLDSASCETSDADLCYNYKRACLAEYEQSFDASVVAGPCNASDATGITG